MEKIFEGHGVEIFTEGEKYILRYDAGEITIQYKDIVITAEEAKKAKESEKSAYDIIMKYKAIEWHEDRRARGLE